MKRLLLLVTVIAAVICFSTAPASAGNTVEKRTKAGWTCFDVPGLGMHCTPPGGGPTATPLQVFDSAGTHFHGTELVISPDVYAGQPCPPEGLATYTLVAGFGYACHHYSH